MNLEARETIQGIHVSEQSHTDARQCILTDREDWLLAKVRMLVGIPDINIQVNKIAMNTHPGGNTI